MKTTAALLTALGLAVAASGLIASAASASGRLTDVDYLKANRCRGLAQSLGVTDTAGLDALIKTEGRSRVDVIYQRGEEEMARGKRDGAKTDGKDRYLAELNGGCTAFLGGASTTASAAAAKDSSSSR